MERWRQPVIPVAVESTATEYSWHIDGWRKNVDWTLTPEDYARLKAGYVCLNCMEPQETPFPEKCSLCQFEMREKQAKLVEFEYRGEKHLGPSTSLQEEVDRLADWADKQDHKPGSSIWVPGRAET